MSYLVLPAGLEPVTPGLKDRCARYCLPFAPRKRSLFYICFRFRSGSQDQLRFRFMFVFNIVGIERLERSTSASQMQHSNQLNYIPIKNKIQI